MPSSLAAPTDDCQLPTDDSREAGPQSEIRNPKSAINSRSFLFISQVYVPDPASVGQHMADVAEEMAARGHSVRVLTSARGYEDPSTEYPRREQRAGVDVRRLPFSSFGKKSIAHRLLGQFAFLAQVIFHGLFTRRLNGIVVTTSPPMASFAALAIWSVRRAPITYWLMDLNPDQMLVLSKATEKSLMVRAMKWLNRQIFAHATNVIVLDRFMAERVKRQYRVNCNLSIIPPWPHIEDFEDIPREDNPFIKKHILPHIESCHLYHNTCRPNANCQLPTVNTPSTSRHSPLATRPFIVMYSGNHSLASPVTTLLQGALRMQDDPRFLFLFIGGGLGKREVEEAIAKHQPPNIISLPYQPLDRLRYSLSAADLHVVTLGDDMVGIIHPCKIYGAMEVGRPVLFIGPTPSHAADLITEYEVGWQTEQGNVEDFVTTIESIAWLGGIALAHMGRRARLAIANHFSRERYCRRICHHLNYLDGY